MGTMHRVRGSRPGGIQPQSGLFPGEPAENFNGWRTAAASLHGVSGEKHLDRVRDDLISFAARRRWFAVDDAGPERECAQQTDELHRRELRICFEKTACRLGLFHPVGDAAENKLLADLPSRIRLAQHA